MVDYILVGAGLSGIAIAEELLSRGKKIVIFEDHSQNSSTVAGGLYNPVILKRFTLAWNADNQLELALPFYRNLEKKLGVELIEDLPVYRKFFSVEEQNNWFEAMDKAQLSPFLDGELVSQLNPMIPSDFSFGRVKGTGRVDTGLLTGKYKVYLKEEKLLEEETFQYNDLRIENDGISYRNLRAGKIIFCEGFGMKNNPFFNFLPLHGNKGEYIIVHAPELKLNVAVKSSVFVLPQGNNMYKIGATYDNRDTAPGPTIKARETLINQLKKLITCNFEVVGQVSGIRPASKDRKPLVGQHPEHSSLFVCNGFGSRGVIIAPSIATSLISHIEDKNPLDSEIDIRRFQNS